MEVKYSIMTHTDGSVQPDSASSAVTNNTYLQEEDKNSLTSLYSNKQFRNLLSQRKHQEYLFQYQL